MENYILMNAYLYYLSNTGYFIGKGFLNIKKVIRSHLNIDDILLHKPVSYSNIMMISPVGMII